MMKPATTNAFPRRSLASVGIFSITQLHLRNPWMIAFWSFMFPGAGHLLLSQYFRGFLLFGWEVFINAQTHVNLSLLYTMQGKFELAKSVADIHWGLLYIPTYLFAVWDSYRTAVDMNNTYLLAAREDAEVKPFAMNSLEVNYLDKRSPLVAVFWSLLPFGPIAWGIAGAFFGFGLGFIIKLRIAKRHNQRIRSTKETEVVLFIACKTEQADSVQDTLWSNAALGVSKLSLDENSP